MGTTQDSIATKAALVEAAGELFAARGFAAVTARQVAQQAKVALSAIPYHFGSMHELYRAVLLRACESFAGERDRMQLALDSSPEEGLRIAVSVVLEEFSGQVASWPAQLLVREELDPSEAFRELVELHYFPQWQWACRVIGRVTGRPPEAAAVHFGVVFLYAQVHVLFTRRWLIDEFAPELRALADDSSALVELLAALTLQAVGQYESLKQQPDVARSRRRTRSAQRRNKP